MKERQCSREEAREYVLEVIEQVEERMESLSVPGAEIASVRRQDSGDCISVIGRYESYSHLDEIKNPEPGEQVRQQLREVHDAVETSHGVSNVGAPMDVYADVHTADWVWGRCLEDGDGSAGEDEDADTVTRRDGEPEVIEDISGVTDEVAASLRAGGVETVEDVREMDQGELGEIKGLGHALAARMKSDVYQPPSWAGDGE